MKPAISGSRLRAIVTFLSLAALTPAAAAQSQFKVLYSFAGGSDGGGLYGGLVFDSLGNLYGGTSGGGAYGVGTVFELTPGSGGRWNETVLYSFNSLSDGE